MLVRQWLPGAGALTRRSLWEQAGGYSEARQLKFGNEDWEFWIRAAKVGLRAAHVPEPLYRYRRQSHGMDARLRFHEHKTREYIYREHRPLFDRYHAGDPFRPEGYHWAAAASLRNGRWARAFRLAVRGLALDPRRRGLAKLAIRALVPGPTWKRLSEIKRTLLRNQPGDS